MIENGVFRIDTSGMFEGTDGWKCIDELNAVGWRFVAQLEPPVDDEFIAMFERTVPDVSPKSPWVTDGVTLPREGTVSVFVSKGGKVNEMIYFPKSKVFYDPEFNVDSKYTITEIDGWMYLPEPVRKETKGDG